MALMTNAPQLTLQNLNTMTRDAFVDALGGLFERAPWIAERAWQARPFRDEDHMIETTRDIVRAASREEQLALLRAHPALEAPGDRATLLSSASHAEQHAAGLDQSTSEQGLELVRLNQAYLKKFGFPFIIAVRGLTVVDILDALRRRLEHDPDAERETAIAETVRIATGRLSAVIGSD